MRGIQETKKQLMEELQAARKKISDLEMIIQSAKETEAASREPDTNLVVLDRNATVRFVKPDVTGSTRGRVSGASFYDYALPEFRQAIRNCFERVLQTGESTRFKSTYEYEDGTQQFFESDVRPVRQGGEITGAAVISKDVTGGRHANTVPSAEQVDPTQYFENLPIMAYDLTFDGKIADCNPMVANTLGYESKEELIGKPLIGTIYAPASRSTAGRLLEEWQNVGQIANQPLQVVTRSGKILDVLLNAATIVAHGHELAHSLSTHVDVTDLKQAQAAVLAERDNLFNVLAAIRDGVLVTNDSHDLLYVNEVLQATFGPWKGKKCYEYFSMGHAPCEVCWVVSAGLGRPGRREWHCQKNHRTYEIVATSIRNPNGGRSGLDVVRDITDRKLAAEAIQESEQRFRLISEHIPVVVYSVLPNQDRVSIFVSSKITELTGYSAKDLIETPPLFRSMIHPDDRERAWGKVIEHRRKKVPLDIEYRIVTAAGQVKWIANKATVLLDDNGETTCINGFLEDITDRKGAEMHLSESEERFRTLFEDAPASLALVGKNGIIQEANNSLLQLLSLQEGEIVGKSFIELAPAFGLDVAEHAADFKSRLDGSPPQREITFINRNNRKTTINVTSSVMRSGGEVFGVLYILNDITDRNLAADERQAQLEFLQTLMDTIPNPIFHKDTNQMYTGCNRAFEQFLGLPKTQIIGKSVYELAPKDLADKYFEKDSELLRHPGTQVYESKVRTGTGELRGVMFSKATFGGSDGKVAGLLGVIVDITDLKRVQAELGLREELYRSRFENSPIALWEEDLSKIKTYVEVLRSKGVHDFAAYFHDHLEDVAACGDMVIMTDANAAALELFQCSTFEDLEHLVRQHAGHRTSDAFLETLIAVSMSGDSFARECVTRTADGEEKFLSLRWVAAPGHTETLAKVLFSALDITHLKQVETELRTVESKLRTYSEELEKIVESRTERIRQLERQRSASEAHAATGRLAARIAHEINNPLAGIKNSFLLVKRAVPKDHPRYEYVTLIEHEIDRIALIVRKMFELYRDEKQVRHEVSVVEGIREVLTISEGFLRQKQISVEINVPDTPITASLPPGFLTQVMLNLLRNAADASEPHGTITVSVDAHNDEVVVKVKDQGQGISDENAPHIFEPFFTTKAHTEMGGLGLGLAVSRSMVEATGGSIAFETFPGKGTTFTLRLPIGTGNTEVRDGDEG